jgi:serine/threonine protein phosphatase PrpC
MVVNSIKMIIKEAYSIKGNSSVNEDRIGCFKNYIWLMDGVTCLSDSKTGELSDSKWFVDKFSEVLVQNLDDSKELKEILKETVIKTYEAYRIATNYQVIEKNQYPSSSLIIIRQKSNQLEYYLLGDSTLIIKSGQEAIHLTQDTLGEFEKVILQKINRTRISQNISFEEARKAHALEILANRSHRNEEGGYYILSFEQNALDYGQQGELEILRPLHFLMMSDGFSRYLDLFKRVESSFEFIENVLERGLSIIGKELYEIEEYDHDCTRYLRFKKRDDTTCIYGTIEASM